LARNGGGTVRWAHRKRKSLARFSTRIHTCFILASAPHCIVCLSAVADGPHSVGTDTARKARTVRSAGGRGQAGDFDFDFDLHRNETVPYKYEYNVLVLARSIRTVILTRACTYSRGQKPGTRCRLVTYPHPPSRHTHSSVTPAVPSHPPSVIPAVPSSLLAYYICWPVKPAGPPPRRPLLPHTTSPTPPCSS
jgi:hypothetical protein